MNSPVLNKTVNNPWKLLNDGCPVLKTFKDEIDNFINFEHDTKKVEGGSGSVLVDIAEGI